MTTAASLISAAVSELGYRESPAGSNRTKFAAEAGHLNGQPWCATFVCAVAKRTGLKLPANTASVYYLRKAFEGTGTYNRTPRVGDIVFYNFSHTGIVESFTATEVTVLEGNTSSSVVGSQSNGGGVYRRTRSRSLVVGYGHPVYSVHVPPTPAPPPPPGPVYDYEEASVKTMMVHVGKLDDQGRGWSDWNPGLGRDPIVVAVTLLGPSPVDDGYWAHQEKVQLSAQPRGGAVRVVVRGGTPGDTVTCWVTVS